jgi:long-chain acyl-CoA synthetase
MNPWGDTWPAVRYEAHYGDRVVRCFTERPGSLLEMLYQAVERNPDGEALVCGDERLNYRELLNRSERLAAGMAARGITAGDRVALLLGNRIEFVLVLFAAARLAAITVPISTREQAPGLAYMLGHCGASMLVHEPELGALLPDATRAPALRARIALGACEGSEDFAELLSDAPLPDPVPVQEEDTAVIMYTSGTTGRPKGAMQTHLGIVHSSMHFQIAMELGPQDCTIAAVPLSHVTGLVGLITTMVRSAGKLVIMPAFKAADFLTLAARERMTHSLMVPAMYNLCLLRPDFASHDLSHWRIGAYGGAPMPVATIQTLARTVPSLMLMNCYGSTETTSPATVMPPGQTASHNDTVGTALPCADIKVMDSAGVEVPLDTLGEIWIGGPMAVRGYWDNPQGTASAFTGGYWHSGDIGSIDAQGYVKVVDRMKDMINRGGYKIYTIEVEYALYEHPAVQECAVVSRPCPVLGERVHAFVVLKFPGTTDVQLRKFCKERLSDYKVPESFTLSDTPLPRNANGKLVKQEMRARLLAELAAQGDKT